MSDVVVPADPTQWQGMTSKTAATALLSILLAATLPAARAADPAFCRQYAQGALKQVRGGLSNSACGRGLQGARWSSDFAVHYEWCLQASLSAAGAERDARARYLRGCAARGSD